MNPVRRGAIIGFGNVAENGHLPGWRARTDSRIVAVADPDPQRRARAQELLPGVRTYSGGDELLRREQLDFVDIATPPALHVPAIIAAARAGVHILCEKPLTTALTDYHSVRTAVHQAGVVLHTVHNWKYSEAFRTVHRWLSRGTLGPLTAIHFDTERNGYAPSRGEWRVNPRLAGGGILVDHGWHAFYLLLALAKERPRRIRTRLDRQRYVDAEVEDTALCVIDFLSLVAEIRLTWAAEQRRTRWQFVGRNGRLTIDDDHVIVQDNGTRHEERLATPLSASSHHPDWFLAVLNGFTQELNDPAARGANQREAEWCLLLLNLAYASGAQHARSLDIPGRNEWFDVDNSAAAP